GTVATVISFIASPHLASFYNDSSLTVMFRVCSFVFILNGISLVQQAELHKELRFKEISLINMSVNICQSLITVGLALSGFRYWSLIFGIMFGHLAKATAMILIKGLYLNPR